MNGSMFKATVGGIPFWWGGNRQLLRDDFFEVNCERRKVHTFFFRPRPRPPPIKSLVTREHGGHYLSLA